MIAIFPEIMTATVAGDVEKLAILVRKYFGGKDRFRPAPDVRAMCESAGISIEYAPLDVFGMLAARDEKGMAVVAAFINKGVAPEEERFMLAHMLGHFFFEMMPRFARSEWEASGFREVTSPLKRFCQNASFGDQRSVELARELVADRFAGALLMPVAMVIKASEKIADQDKLASFFNVSRACLQRRMVDCGLMGAMPANFMEAEEQLQAEHAEHQRTPPKDMRARSTVSQPRRASRSPRPTDLVVDSAPVPASPKTAPRGLGGMDRIREIARKLDKNGR